MATRDQENQRLLRRLFSGSADAPRHALLCVPQQVSIAEWPLYDYTLSGKPVRDWVPWVVENYTRQVRSLEVLGDDSVPMAPLTTGTHIYAAAFGCPVHSFEDDMPCALPLVRTAAEADALETPDLWSCPTLYRTFELAAAVLQELGSDTPLAPPDVQTGFDTAALVWNKEDFLLALADPSGQSAVERLVARCARLLERFLLEFRRQFPTCTPCHCPLAWCPPELPPWVSNDECGALGPASFREFCLPELLRLSETFGGLGMHCCADAEHQFPLFGLIPGFYAFNRVPARQGYEPLLEHFSGREAPVHVLAWVPDAEMERLARTATPGTRFVFVHYAAGSGDDSAWLDRMRSVCPRDRGDVANSRRRSVSHQDTGHHGAPSE